MFLSLQAAVLLATEYFIRSGKRRACEGSPRGAGAAARGAGAGMVGLRAHNMPRRAPERSAPSPANLALGGGEPGPPASIYSFNQCECLPLAGVHARVMR